MVLSGIKIVNVVNVNLEGYKKVWDELSVCDER